LPVIKDSKAGVSFSRAYAYRGDGLIDFTTCLTIIDGTEKKEYGGKIPLRPVKRAELTMWLDKCGFKEAHIYGGFDKQPFSEDSFHMVILAKK
jgi:hypothetical protein